MCHHHNILYNYTRTLRIIVPGEESFKSANGLEFMIEFRMVSMPCPFVVLYIRDIIYSKTFTCAC